MDLFSSVGSQEILVILLVALIVIGPNKIADVGKQLGTMSRNLKKATSDFTGNLQAELDEEERAILCWATAKTRRAVAHHHARCSLS